MIDREDYEREIKMLKARVQDDAAVDEVISKGDILELIKLMDQYSILSDVMWKSIRGPIYELSREIDKIKIQKAIVEGMNWWLTDQVWVLNDDSEVSDNSQ